MIWDTKDFRKEDTTTKALRETTDKFDLIKIENFCLTKDITKVKISNTLLAFCLKYILGKIVTTYKIENKDSECIAIQIVREG